MTLCVGANVLYPHKIAKAAGLTPPHAGGQMNAPENLFHPKLSSKPIDLLRLQAKSGKFLPVWICKAHMHAPRPRF
jgi:hypothetical protein